MKCALPKSAKNGRVVAARMAESCVNDIDCNSPKNSSAERRTRATSPNARLDEAGGGSLKASASANTRVRSRAQSPIKSWVCSSTQNQARNCRPKAADVELSAGERFE